MVSYALVQRGPSVPKIFGTYIGTHGKRNSNQILCGVNSMRGKILESRHPSSEAQWLRQQTCTQRTPTDTHMSHCWRHEEHAAKIAVTHHYEGRSKSLQRYPGGKTQFFLKTDTACCKRLATRNYVYIHLGTQSIWTTLEIFCSKSLGSPEPT